jgi:hypothetical protein
MVQRNTRIAISADGILPGKLGFNCTDVAESAGGGGGIRTLARVAPRPDFESGTFNHSATPPVLLRFVEASILAGSTACLNSALAKCCGLYAAGINANPAM